MIPNSRSAGSPSGASNAAKPLDLRLDVRHEGLVGIRSATVVVVVVVRGGGGRRRSRGGASGRGSPWRLRFARREQRWCPIHIAAAKQADQQQSAQDPRARHRRHRRDPSASGSRRMNPPWPIGGPVAFVGGGDRGGRGRHRRVDRRRRFRCRQQRGDHRGRRHHRRGRLRPALARIDVPVAAALAELELPGAPAGLHVEPCRLRRGARAPIPLAAVYGTREMSAHLDQPPNVDRLRRRSPLTSPRSSRRSPPGR